MMPGWLMASFKSWEKFAFSMIRFLSLLPAYCSDASVTPYFTMQALYQFIF
jgi:hypothetical protein